jgi:hypothetical protein
MTPAELIAAIRQSNSELIPEEFVSLYKFSPLEKEGERHDSNLEYRTAVVEELF